MLPRRQRSRSPRSTSKREQWALELTNQLAGLGVPWVLVRLVGLIVLAGLISPDDIGTLACVEYFAGVASVVAGFQELGLPACAYEKEKDYFGLGSVKDARGHVLPKSILD